jgi:hypothetical protein
MKHAVNMAVAGLAILLSACSGGGDEAPPPPADQPQLKDYYQGFATLDNDTGEQTLTLVNVADFGQKIALGSVTDLTGLYAGTRDGNLIRDIRPHSAYFIQGNRWQRVRLRHGQSQVPAQVSSDALADSCMDPRLVEPTLGSEAGAVLFYSTAGPDTICFNDDDVYRRIGINDSAGTAPAAGVIAVNLIEFRDGNGALLSLLAQAWDGTLRLYAADFSSSTILPASGWLTRLTAVGSSGLFELNGQIRRLDWTGAISAPLHTVLEQIQYWDAVADATHYYFMDGGYAVPNSLHRVRLDGTAVSEQFPGGGRLLGLTASKIIVFDGSSQVLAVDKDPASPAEPTVLEEANYAFAVHGYAPLLYTTIDYYGNEAVARRLDANGTASTRASNSAWIGVNYAKDWTVGQWLGTSTPPVIGGFEAAFIPDIFNFGFPGATVRRVDLAGNATAIAPVTGNEFWSVIGIGSVGMGGIYTERPEPQYTQSDVFSFDTDNSRFERHTIETDANEIPYAF